MKKPCRISSESCKPTPLTFTARSYAAKCKTALAAGVGKKNNLEGQLSKVIVPQIDLKDAPVGDVLNFLADKTEELTGGNLVPNFIYKGSPEQRENTLISLSLRSVPMTEIVKYVGQLSRSPRSLRRSCRRN